MNGVLEGKCYMAAQKAAFIVPERICGGTWAFISVKVPSVTCLLNNVAFPLFTGFLSCFWRVWRNVKETREKGLRGVFFVVMPVYI